MMARISSCFSFLLRRKTERSKVRSKVLCSKKATTGSECQKVKPVEFMNMADTVDVSEGGGDAPACDANAFVRPAAGSARQERDANEDKASSTRRDSSDAGDAEDPSSGYRSGDGSEKAVMSAETTPDAAGACFVVGRMSPSGSPAAELKRSCSNIETVRYLPAEEFDDLPAKSRSYGNLLKALSPSGRTTTPRGGGAPDASPTASVKTSCSADRVMLRKRSSSRQVLPSRSRKLWWRLLLWSHRNLHRPGTSFTVPEALPSADTYGASHQNEGYTSDTLDAVTAREPSRNKEVAAEAGPIPNQRVAFPSSETTSSLDRVSAWVNSLGNVSSFHAVVDEEEDVTVTERDDEDGAVRAWCSDEIVVERSTAAAEKHTRAKRRTAEEAVQANSMVQTLNAVSSVARISGMGLRAVPMIAAFSSLRAVDLSGNFIVDIYPGSLPKGLHSLDLSRNRIASIEGLRELTRLRVLNLSYNRISRIGHGLSSCTAIRELYLAGNRIGDVEGLHRLLKLAVLDVSFNKITTTKSLGQLVASYGSLRALNLLGNPVQANLGDDTLRKAVSGLLPRLEYLNKKAVKPHHQRGRGREVANDSVARAAALGTSGRGARRRTSRRVSQSPGSPGKKSSGSSRSRSKTRAQGSSPSSRR